MIAVLWDADYLVYAAGFAVERSDYLLMVNSEIYGTYENRTDLSKARKEVEKALPDAAIHEWKRGPYLEEDGEIRAKHNVRSMVEGVLEAICVRKGCEVEDIEYAMYLTASPNFRDWIATIKPYKGNRANNAKPMLYDALRTYLRDVWGACVIRGHEADDEICIKQHELMAVGTEAIIVHVDKDLLMIPGEHYNPNKGWAKIDRMRGLREFYRQIISGDTADNIGGVYKCGEKAAKDAITPGMTEAEMWQTCVDLYAESTAKHGDKTGYAHMTPLDAALENAQLLWMRTESHAPWQAPQHTQSNARPKSRSKASDE